MKKSFERFWSLFTARNYEFLRDRSAMVWTFVFPFFLLGGFFFLFNRGQPSEQLKVAVTGQQTVLWQAKIDALPQVSAVVIEDLDLARDKLAHHKIDLLLDTGRFLTDKVRYFVSETAPKSYIAERLVIYELGRSQQGLRGPPEAFQRHSVTGFEVPYLDWFFPGLLGMNMMYSAMFGVGYVIVRYRKNGVLKRFAATPLTAFEFLAAQLASRLFLIIFTTTVFFGGALLLFGFQVRGSWLALLLLLVLGAGSLVSLGLVVAARTESEEFAGGLLNLLIWPMMMLSEVWFSLEGAAPWIQKLTLIFPLTHLIRGARAVMNDGAGLIQVSGSLLTLLFMNLIFLCLGSMLFRWRQV